MAGKKKYHGNPKYYDFDKVKDPKKFKDLGKKLLKDKIKKNSK